MIKVKLWALDKNVNGQMIPVALQEVDKTETENHLENILVSNPELLMKGLKLIGRQTPTEGGPLDLLGVDQDGNLIVFELKRGTLSREAVAQVIDYASYLHELERETIIKHISDRSGNGGIEKLEFESWYQEQFSGNMDALDNPPKMVLVGLGADDRTKRMVSYLSKTGVDISLITFYAFKQGEEIFLAKQVEIELQEKEETQKQSYTKESNEENLKKVSIKLNATDILAKASGLIRTEMLSAYEWPGKTGRSFSLVEKTEEGKPTYRVYISLYLADNHPNSVQLVFQPRAIDVAGEIFDRLREKHKGLTMDKNGFLFIWLKDGEQWTNFSEDFKEIVLAVELGWKNKQNSNDDN